MQYNKLTYLEDAGINDHGKKLWRVKCFCGEVTVKIASQVRTGKTKSCGCLKSAGNRRSHGQRDHPLYSTWCNIKSRCDNENNPAFKNYGARGISYDPKWSDFSKFLTDVGEKPSLESSLDRIDNNKGYFKDNLRWTDRITQRRNSRAILPVTINGNTKLVTDWCKQYDISIGAVHRRLKKGENIVSAITRPKAKRFQK